MSTEREKLESYRRLSRDEFKANFIIQDAACYSFIVAIQACIDIASHIIAACGFRKPVGSADLFAVLGEEAILSDEFVAKLNGMVGFRNILAHMYWLIDYDKVYDSLPSGLEDIARFGQYIVEFAESYATGIERD